MTVGERVRLARERVGLSQRELAREAGLSQSTVSRVEAGAHPLAITELHRVAVATGTTLRHLIDGDDRRSRLLTAARVATAGDSPAGPVAATAAADLLELDATLDSLSVDGAQARRPLPAPPVTTGRSAAQGRAAADAFRTELCLGVDPIADVDELIEQVSGIDVAHRDLGGLSGFCAVDPDRGTAVVLVAAGRDEPADRKRFTAAHELAHLVFGDPGHVEHAPGRQRPPREARADEFARHLLLPLDGARSWLDAQHAADVTEAQFATLANLYRVSPMVAYIQLRTLRRAPADVDDTAMPTGRALAYRHGWGSAYDATQAAARAARPPVRLVDRATRAYQQGKIGVAPLAALLGVATADARATLAQAGITPPRRTADADVAAAVAGHRMAGLAPSGDDVAMARRIAAGELSAAAAVEAAARAAIAKERAARRG